MVLSFGKSKSSVENTQAASSYLTQQFSGNCNVSCQNVMSNITIDLINSNVSGGINVSQTCSTNAQCLITSNNNATADTIFKSANSSNSKNAAQGIGNINLDNTSIDSRQSIVQSINQSNSEQCNVSSMNQMNNVTIFAANSNISGGINLSQNSSTQANCSLSNSMQAAAQASGLAQNTATSGKDKKGQKKGSKSNKLRIITYIIVGAVIIFIVYIIAKIFTSHSESSDKKKQQQEVAEARAKAGCPGGVMPILDKKGKAIIDPKTNRPICPPPPPSSSAPSQTPLPQPQPQTPTPTPTQIMPPPQQQPVIQVVQQPSPAPVINQNVTVKQQGSSQSVRPVSTSSPGLAAPIINVQAPQPSGDIRPLDQPIRSDIQPSIPFGAVPVLPPHPSQTNASSTIPKINVGPNMNE